MNEEYFPKFQYSEFLNGRDSGQIVVRGNDFDEFVANVATIKEYFKKPQTEEEIPFPDRIPMGIPDNAEFGAEDFDVAYETVKETPKQHFGYAIKDKVEAPEDYCGVHKFKMTARTSKKDGHTYYDHRRNFGTREVPEWDVCYGEGWKNHD